MIYWRLLLVKLCFGLLFVPLALVTDQPPWATGVAAFLVACAVDTGRWYESRWPGGDE